MKWLSPREKLRKGDCMKNILLLINRQVPGKVYQDSDFIHLFSICQDIAAGTKYMDQKWKKKYFEFVLKNTF